ncbi:S-layer homology domain-containing protein, partial [Flavonifractor sp. An306]|uniref:S-layer homology domain-containing protein n=1 Tax=Flavonifractor sp. An306 TaxID=1965629 RepID=UPI000B57C1B0
MRNLKRTLSLVLAALMLMSMMVVGAGAATKDFTDSDEIQHKEAVEVMVALNVVSGKDDGSYFAPTDTFTREEMAKVVSYVMNGGVEPVVGTKVTPTYSDIKGIWSEKYIEYCTSMG